MQREWITATNRRWDEDSMQMRARDMFERMFWMKFLPPGRGLWAMGSPLTMRTSEPEEHTDLAVERGDALPSHDADRAQPGAAASVRSLPT